MQRQDFARFCRNEMTGRLRRRPVSTVFVDAGFVASVVTVDQQHGGAQAHRRKIIETCGQRRQQVTC